MQKKHTTTSVLRRRLNDRSRKLQDILRDEPGGIGLLRDVIDAACAVALAEDEQGRWSASNGGLALLLAVSDALDADGPHRARALAETLAPFVEEAQSRLEVERHHREEMEADKARALIAKGRSRGFSAGYDSGFGDGYDRAQSEAA
jgi:hypothetical protein